MIEITSGASAASRGTLPGLYSMGPLLQLFPYQLECLAESSGNCTGLYTYIRHELHLTSSKKN